MSSAESFQAAQFARVNARVTAITSRLAQPEPDASGRLTRLSGMRLEVSGLKASIGSRCWIETGHRQGVIAEVVGFEGTSWFSCAKADARSDAWRQGNSVGRQRLGIGWRALAWSHY